VAGGVGWWWSSSSFAVPPVDAQHASEMDGKSKAERNKQQQQQQWRQLGCQNVLAEGKKEEEKKTNMEDSEHHRSERSAYSESTGFDAWALYDL
jgi:hypothetical protein